MATKHTIILENDSGVISETTTKYMPEPHIEMLRDAYRKQFTAGLVSAAEFGAIRIRVVTQVSSERTYLLD